MYAIRSYYDVGVLDGEAEFRVHFAGIDRCDTDHTGGFLAQALGNGLHGMLGAAVDRNNFV